MDKEKEVPAGEIILPIGIEWPDGWPDKVVKDEK